MAIILQAPQLPHWLQVMVIVGSLIGYAIGIVTFFDRRKRERTTDVREDAKTDEAVKLLGWTLTDRLALEKRLVAIEHELISQKELHALLEKMMANVLHSPHRPELDRLLEKIDRGDGLTNAEYLFLTDWLHQIATDPAVSKGEQTAASILLVLVHKRYGDLEVLH